MNNRSGEQVQTICNPYKTLWGLEPKSRSVVDFKVRYFDEADLTEQSISELCDLVNGTMLVIGFASPDFDLKAIGALIRLYLPCNVKFFMVSTAGELSSGFKGDVLYKPDTEGRKKVVLQSFSRQMLQGCQLITMKLPNDDFLNNEIMITADERVERLKRELCETKLDFPIRAGDTVALTFIDGLAKCETSVMQAIYDSKCFPCVVIGGSIAAPMDMPAYIYDGKNMLKDHMLICLMKVKPNYKFGLFKSQGFKREGMEFTIADANHAMRYVTKIVDENLQIIDFVTYLKRKINCETVEQLEVALQQYSFASEIDGDIFIRAVQKIDKETRKVYFFSDVSVGEKLIVVKRSSFIDSLNRDWQKFMENKPRPIAGILIDCISRRMVNHDCLNQVDLFDDVKVGGFSSAGELLGVPMNETLTAIFFFKTNECENFQDKYHDYFPIFYGECISYFLLKRLKQIQIIGELENKLFEKLKKIDGINTEYGSISADEVSFAKIFKEDLLTMHLDNDIIAGKSALLSVDNHIKPEGKSIRDIGLLVNYMQMTLDSLSHHKQNLEKTVLSMKKSIYKYAKDELTDTYTRRAGYELINSLMKRKLRGTDTLVFAFIDLNNLKTANDIVGHEEGDYYLQKTVSLLQENLTEVDFICRYGGDEFILVFPNGKIEKVKEILVDANCRLAEISESDHKPYFMSFAYGTFVYQYESGISFENILKKLDGEMYQIKFQQKESARQKYRQKHN